MTYQRFYRSATSKIFGGVAGGIAEYFGMDPVIIRIIFVLAAIFGGGGVIIYLILWIAVPERPNTSTMFNMGSSPESEAPADTAPKNEPAADAGLASRRHSGSLISGIILIAIGALILTTKLIPNLFFSDLWPLVLVIVGIVLIVNSMKKTGRNE